MGEEGSSEPRKRVSRKKWKESGKEEYVQRESRVVGWGWDGIVKRGKRYERKVLDATKNCGAVGKGSERKGNNRKKEKEEKGTRASEQTDGRTNESERGARNGLKCTRGKSGKYV